MNVKNILAGYAHRPWDLPNSRWKFYQEWNQAIFLHWDVDPIELKKYIPPHLEVDLIDGRVWVSIVAFRMNKIRLRNLPHFSPLSNFEEINIRTYVKHGNRAGVYFLSIEAGSVASCRLARVLSGLPYRHSKIKRRKNFLVSENQELGDKLEFNYHVLSKLDTKTQKDRWLTERYALFQNEGLKLFEFEIHHLEWILFEVDVYNISVAYPRFQRLLHGAPIITHYSPGVQVVAWDRVSHGIQ